MLSQHRHWPVPSHFLSYWTPWQGLDTVVPTVVHPGHPLGWVPTYYRTTPTRAALVRAPSRVTRIRHLITQLSPAFKENHMYTRRCNSPVNVHEVYAIPLGRMLLEHLALETNIFVPDVGTLLRSFTPASLPDLSLPFSREMACT